MAYPSPEAGQGQPASAGEGLLGVEPGEDLEVAQHGGELVGCPRLAAVAAAVGVADQPEAAAVLVLGDREVTGYGVPVAGAGCGAPPEPPTRDDHGATGIADLADLEDGRLATPAHGGLPPRGPGANGPAVGGAP